MRDCKYWNKVFPSKIGFEPKNARIPGGNTHIRYQGGSNETCKVYINSHQGIPVPKKTPNTLSETGKGKEKS